MMKTQLPSITLSLMICSILLLLSCLKEQVEQFTVDLTYPDGTKEARAMVDGSMLLVHDGDKHVIAKATGGNENELQLEVTRYEIKRDSVKQEYTIQKASSENHKIDKGKRTLLVPGGYVHATFQSMAMIDTGKRPIGACQGNCCEATCFSVFCCGDEHECKNAPCDCKGPSNCPSPQPNPQASHFFELFKSGKNEMVFKD